MSHLTQITMHTIYLCFSDGNLNPAIYTVRGGTINKALESVTQDGVNRRLDRVFMLPTWNQPFLNNDIALLRMSNKVLLNNYMIPACLPEPFDTPSAANVTECFVSGYGRIGLNGKFIYVFYIILLIRTCS